MPRTTHVSHQHHSSKLIRQQVDYASTEPALATALKIISTKISHSRRLLIPYHQSRERVGHDNAEHLRQVINKLSNLSSQAAGATNRTELFQIEAQAASLYWRAFSQICHQTEDWKRVHPHAGDSLNVLLNTGYTLLARKCLNAIIGTGLLPEIGLIHGDNSRDPLVYDLVEIFRQTAVDSVILPIFTRRPRSGVQKNSRTFVRIIALLNVNYQNYFWYKRRCEKLENIIKLESLGLKQAILANQVWRPYRHQWSRHRVCRQKNSQLFS